MPGLEGAFSRASRSQSEAEWERVRTLASLRSQRKLGCDAGIYKFFMMLNCKFIVLTC